MPSSARRMKKRICSSGLMCSMLMVTFIFFLLMILFVEVCSSCTPKVSVELIEVLDLATVVSSVPVGFEERAPVGISIVVCSVDGRTVGKAGSAPLFVRPADGGGVDLELVHIVHETIGDELTDRIDSVGQANSNVNVFRNVHSGCYFSALISLRIRWRAFSFSASICAL